MEVIVTTVYLETGEVSDERAVVFNKDKGRDWLAKHMWYCFCNGYGIQMRNKEDNEPVMLVAA